MTTPAPGDLSARHVEVLRAIQKFFTFPDDAECKALDAAIAALSALPAAGGEVAAWQYRFIDPEEGPGGWLTIDEQHVALMRGKKSFEVRALGALTTPQPSAVEGGGSPESAMQKVIDKVVDGAMGQREEVLRAFVAKYGFQPDEAVQVSGPDGSWRIIRRSDMYATPDAAVGAQGDECFCDAQGIGAPGVSCGDCPRDYAAPADVGAQGDDEELQAYREFHHLGDPAHWMPLPAAPTDTPADSVERIVLEMREYLTGRYREDVDDRMGEWMARLAAVAIGGTGDA